jgi:hypothetical protein
MVFCEKFDPQFLGGGAIGGKSTELFLIFWGFKAFSLIVSENLHSRFETVVLLPFLKNQFVNLLY